MPLYDTINKDDARALEKLSARLAQMASAVALKHLQGKHDQQSHGRRGASSDIIVGHELDEDQADAIGKYTGELYDDINSALRSGKLPSGDISDAVSAIDVSFGKVAKSTTVYRGLDATHLNQLKPGDKFTERGYSSASSDYRIAQGRADKGFKVVMEVRLKRGQEAMKIPGRESEILLPRDSQFRFVKGKWMPEPGGGGHYSWIVDLLNPIYKITTKHLAGKHDQSRHGVWANRNESRNNNINSVAKMQQYAETVKKHLGVNTEVSFVSKSVLMNNCKKLSMDVTPEELESLKGFFDPRTNTIMILNKTALESNKVEFGINLKNSADIGVKGIILHELAHALDKKTGNQNVQFSDEKTWQDIFLRYKTKVIDNHISGNNDGVISRYSISNPSEMFAEAFTCYILQPSYLKKYQHEIYNIIDGFGLDANELKAKRELDDFVEIVSGTGYKWARRAEQEVY